MLGLGLSIIREVTEINEVALTRITYSLNRPKSILITTEIDTFLPELQPISKPSTFRSPGRVEGLGPARKTTAIGHVSIRIKCALGGRVGFLLMIRATRHVITSTTNNGSSRLN